MKSRKLRLGGITLLLLILAMALSVSSVFATEYISVSGDNDKIKIHKNLDTGGQAVPSHSVTFLTTFEQSKSEPNTLSVTGPVPSITMNFSNPTKDISEYLDFTGVTFSKPGNYCFKVTEGNPTLTTIKPVSGSETSYYIYVHVVNGEVDQNTGKVQLVVDSYSAADGSDPTAKVNYDDHDGLIFKNEWDNFNMYVEKKVDGLQGDKTKEFNINLHLRKESSGTHTVKIYGAEGTPKVAGTSVTPTSPSTLSLTGETSRQVVLTLKDGDKVFVDGMNSTFKYAVTEDKVDGYVASGLVQTFLAIKDNNGITVTVTNTHKNGNNPPTGLFINNWPYIAVILVVIAGAILFIRRRKARYDYEADL